VPTPFCHFRGALAFYDPESRILFSGDLFGGLNQLGRVHLFAEEADWAGIAQFHQIYMPTREALRYAVQQIRSLRPAVEVIAPQHGHVIAGDLVPLFLERMEQLLVGSDLLAIELDDKYAVQYGELVGMLIESARQVVGNEEVLQRLKAARNDELRQCLAFVGEDWRVARSPYVCATRVFARLGEHEEPTFVEALRDQVLRFCSEHGVPVPPIGWGIESREAGLGARGSGLGSRKSLWANDVRRFLGARTPSGNRPTAARNAHTAPLVVSTASPWAPTPLPLAPTAPPLVPTPAPLAPTDPPLAPTASSCAPAEPSYARTQPRAPRRGRQNARSTTGAAHQRGSASASTGSSSLIQE
jgi:hypothetical protein